jgi:hypothetical protein
MAYRILSLDGGGSWALNEALALVDIYGPDTGGHEVLRKFDLVVANSGGSIVLGGLLADYPLKEILGLLLNEQDRRSIFQPTHHITDQIVAATTKALSKITDDVPPFGPRYSAEQKLTAFERIMKTAGALPMNKVTESLLGPNGEPVRVIIVGFDYFHKRTRLFRSHNMQSKNCGTGDASRITLAQAIHASTNAPVNYFDGPAVFPSPDHPEQRLTYWDGGISGNNNPTLLAVTEALALGHAPESLTVLSMGTGTVAYPPDDPTRPTPFAPPRHDSLFRDLEKLARAILDDPPDQATFVSHVITSRALPEGGSRVIRVSPLVAPILSDGRWCAPSGMPQEEFLALRALDLDAIKPDEVDLIHRYGQMWLQGLAPNQPIRMDGNLRAEVGHGDFPSAKAAWLTLTENDLRR